MAYQIIVILHYITVDLSAVDLPIVDSLGMFVVRSQLCISELI